VALSEFEISNNKINGTLFNYGIQEVTIPGLLISYYNSEKKLIYVDHFFFAKVLRSSATQYFEYNLLNLENLTLLQSSLKNCFVNGLPNAIVIKKSFPIDK
jgi:hypothetical protein